MKAENLRNVLIALLPVVLIALNLGTLAGEVLLYKQVKSLETQRLHPVVLNQVVQASPSASPSQGPLAAVAAKGATSSAHKK